MAKIGILNLYGNSGNKYQFEIYPIDAVFDQQPALYAVTRRYISSDGDNRHSVVYIGESDDISKSFVKHKKRDCFKQHEANCICIQLDSNKRSRLFKMKDLTDRINPRCNEIN